MVSVSQPWAVAAGEEQEGVFLDALAFQCLHHLPHRPVDFLKHISVKPGAGLALELVTPDRVGRDSAAIMTDPRDQIRRGRKLFFRRVAWDAIGPAGASQPRYSVPEVFRWARAKAATASNPQVSIRFHGMSEPGSISNCARARRQALVARIFTKSLISRRIARSVRFLASALAMRWRRYPRSLQRLTPGPSFPDN